MSEEIGWDEAQVGQRYCVEIQDCCVEAHFVAVLVGLDWPDYAKDDELPGGWDIQEARFDNGVTITNAGSALLKVVT